MMTHQLSQSSTGLALLLGMIHTAACAGAFAISPVRSTLSADHKIDSLVITNQGTEPTIIQLEALAWSQDNNGKDIYTPSKDILATPPVFTLPPNGKQVIRLGLRRLPITTDELTYRLFLQEVPAAPKANFTGLNMTLRMSIPVFVVPQVQTSAVLSWQLRQSPEGQLKLSAYNSGTAHIQVGSFTLTPAGASPIPVQQVASYLLLNQKREWLVKNYTLAVGTKVHLTAQTDKNEVQADLVVE